jgi:hypothetical protein
LPDPCFFFFFNISIFPAYLVSSAVVERYSFISKIKRRNSARPRTLPCVTPAITLGHSECLLFHFRYCFLPPRYLAIHDVGHDLSGGFYDPRGRMLLQNQKIQHVLFSFRHLLVLSLQLLLMHPLCFDQVGIRIACLFSIIVLCG